jgi:shikimate kinase
MSQSPIVFIAGPSGVGKSKVGEWLVEDLNWLLIDIDIPHPFRTHNLQREWHLFSTQLETVALFSVLQQKIAEAGNQGAVVSLPSTRILTRKQIEAARSVGIYTVLLWGSEEFCKTACQAREQSKGQVLDNNRYDRSNRRAFDAYQSSEYDDVRVETFHSDGSRCGRGDIVKTIRKRVDH